MSRIKHHIRRSIYVPGCAEACAVHVIFQCERHFIFQCNFPVDTSSFSCRPCMKWVILQRPNPPSLFLTLFFHIQLYTYYSERHFSYDSRKKRKTYTQYKIKSSDCNMHCQLKKQLMFRISRNCYILTKFDSVEADKTLSKKAHNCSYEPQITHY